ncbi:phage tail protein [Clostridium sp. AN503]|uniref:phage tail protein n=1 Tax=Clostridium sp. AN503 TaxID=3160598 RepID=UPI0034592EA8
MVDYKRGELLQIIPVNLLSPEVMAISYAVEEEKRIFLRYTAATSLYAAISDVPESVLDLMALELNAQYYEQNLPRNVKEQLVEQTLLWYMHAGTPSVLTEFLKTIMAGGYIKEWYEYGGEPYFFNAYARVDENMELPLGYGKNVKQRINIYKNARSWMEWFSFVINTQVLAVARAGNRMKMQLSFFSRDNQPFSFLNGLWTLGGSRYLNGYEGEALVDFYPVRQSLRIAAGAVFEAANIWSVRANTSYVEMLAEEAMRLSGSKKMDVSAGTVLEVTAEHSYNTLTDSYMTKMNQMDDSWKLNGDRKLDGGRYIL